MGDAAGVYIPETADLRPATPPPDFDLATALESSVDLAALHLAYCCSPAISGPVDAVDQVLDRSAEEITLWVEETRRAHDARLDLDHAVAMVHERTRQRYAVLNADADPAVAAKFERISSTASSVAGIMHWLEKSGPPA